MKLVKRLLQCPGKMQLRLKVVVFKERRNGCTSGSVLEVEVSGVAGRLGVEGRVKGIRHARHFPAPVRCLQVFPNLCTVSMLGHIPKDASCHSWASRFWAYLPSHNKKCEVVNRKRNT